MICFLARLLFYHRIYSYLSFDYVLLKTSKGRKEKGLFLVEGSHLCEEAEKSGLLQELLVLDKIKLEATPNESQQENNQTNESETNSVTNHIITEQNQNSNININNNNPLNKTSEK